jgi:hypothetical protein
VTAEQPSQHRNEKGTPLTEGRIVIIPFLHGKLSADGSLVEPDMDDILEKWLQRHPQFRGREFHVIRAKMTLEEDDTETDLVRVTVDFSPDLADYDPNEDADLYEKFLADERNSSPPKFHKIWIEQCEAAQGIEDDFGTQKALEYLVGEKFLNFLEAADANADFRAEIPAFVARIKEIFEPWQLAGIWDEGGWDKYGGRRRIALFGGLFGSKGVIGHVSSTGASSYPQSTVSGSQYARCAWSDSIRSAHWRWCRNLRRSRD